jgi:hypothetical protein
MYSQGWLGYERSCMGVVLRCGLIIMFHSGICDAAWHIVERVDQRNPSLGGGVQ